MIRINDYLEISPELGIKIFNVQGLLQDFGITMDEIFLLTKLFYFPDNELVPIVINGIKQREWIEVDPICVAVYDFYYGAKIALSRNMGFDDTEMKMELAKSFFKKYSPEKYIHCF